MLGSRPGCLDFGLWCWKFFEGCFPVLSDGKKRTRHVDKSLFDRISLVLCTPNLCSEYRARPVYKPVALIDLIYNAAQSLGQKVWLENEDTYNRDDTSTRAYMLLEKLCFFKVGPLLLLVLTLLSSYILLLPNNNIYRQSIGKKCAQPFCRGLEKLQI